MATFYKCDSCGKITDDHNDLIQLDIPQVNSYGQISSINTARYGHDEYTTTRKEICNSCALRIRRAFDSGGV